MFSVVSYDGKKLIPAPFVRISKTYTKSEDGSVLGSIFNLSIIGTIVAWKGSPTSSGTFWASSGEPSDEVVVGDSRLGVMLRKQEAIRELFSNEGKSFEIQSADGSTPLKCNPRITDIDFPEEKWYDLCQYTINLEADALYGGPNALEDFVSNSGVSDKAFIKNASESWSIETNEGVEELLGNKLYPTFRLTHNLNAVGTRFFDETGKLVREPWKNARNWVLPRMGLNSSIIHSSGVNNLPSYYNGYNYVKNEQPDILGGSFSVTETWILSSGSATENFSVSTGSSTDGLTTVSIEGTIQGYDTPSVNEFPQGDSDRYTNAVNKFNEISSIVFTRAQTYAGISLNITPNNSTVGRNPFTGVINYSYQYDTRPSNCISGVKSEVISLVDNLHGDVFASIPVLGRTKGPVLQDISTTQATSRALSIEIVVEPPSFGNNTLLDIRTAFLTSKPSINPTYSGQIQKVIDAVDPSKIDTSATVFRNQPRESWEPRSGRYSYQIEWTYEEG